jgi:hypothetical protein
MNPFERFLYWIARIEMPLTDQPSYNAFHVLCLFVMLAGIFLIVRTVKSPSDASVKNVLLVYSINCLVLEVIKQLMFASVVFIKAKDGSVSALWGYHWVSFPFQFCSVPMYVGLLSALVKKGRFQESLFMFLGTFGLFAGLAVMVFPNTVFTDIAFINLQTMVHHGSQVLIGFYLIRAGRVPLSFRKFLGGFAVFSACALTALVLDIVMHFSGVQGFNLFYISPYEPCVLPILSTIFAEMPYLVFLLLYFVGFSLCGFLTMLFAHPKAAAQGLRNHFAKRANA